MDRETWDNLIGHIRQALIDRSYDPDHFYQADWDEKEIWISNEGDGEGEWVRYDMKTEYKDQAPMILAERMVGRAIGRE